jgi:hypothetical protein
MFKYYKDADGNLYGYLADGSQDDLIGDKTPITNEEHKRLVEEKSKNNPLSK